MGTLNAMIDEKNNCIEKMKENNNTKINTLNKLISG